MKLSFKLIILALIIAVVSACSGKTEKYSEVKADDGFVKIGVDSVSDGQAHFYHINLDGKDIKFFVLKSADGKIRAAFDACDVCFPEKKGYRQEGDFMVCNNCGQKFESNQINEVKGGCNPSPLNRNIEGEVVSISVNDLKSGEQYF